MTIPWTMESLTGSAVNLFQNEYAWTQLFASFLAYYLSECHNRYLYSCQLGPAFALMIVSLVRYLWQRPQMVYQAHFTDRSSPSFNTMLLIAILSLLHQSFLDLLASIGFVESNDLNNGGGGGDAYFLYHNLLLRWLFNIRVNFTTSMLACSKDLSHFRLHEIWDIVKRLILKPYYSLCLILSAKVLCKWRNSTFSSTNVISSGNNSTTNDASRKRTNSNNNQEEQGSRNTEPSESSSSSFILNEEDEVEPREHVIERAKKYLLEDFIEENRITLKDMNNLKNEDSLNELLKLLAKCDYDYERFKKEREQLIANKSVDHTDFFNEIKMLKKQIKHNRRKNCDHKKDDGAERENKDKNQVSERTETCNNNENDELEKQNKSKEIEVDEDNLLEGKEMIKDSKDSSSIVNDFIRKSGISKFSGVSYCSSSEGKEKAETVVLEQKPNFYLRYSCLQMVVFTCFGLAVRRLFFLCYVQFCILTSVIYGQLLHNRQRDKYWLAYFYINCIILPGIFVSRYLFIFLL